MSEEKNKKRIISRRELLASMGAAGVALAYGGLIQATTVHANNESVSEAVYGSDAEKKKPPVKEPFAVDWHNVKEYGARGNGSSDDFPALSRLLATRLSEEGGTVYLPQGTYRIGTNLTIPANAHLVFDKGALLAPDAGVTVTIAATISAGTYRIFAGSGSVRQRFR
ncbi:glycosyl hydrolase family 28-related protein [Paenibacillus eucommiae]|uniref:Polygalacturonase n=1 Tax=Paenibacillus eucommiae TaxID=1355755 RepID=A0ABS4ISJ9_9BACL|nr:glycosyl hydrolase family 28-related protein [Paenibacillus eucommiae]MBP1989564.1 polygalacturonase [Paenibacillus eucommiae]